VTIEQIVTDRGTQPMKLTRAEATHRHRHSDRSLNSMRDPDKANAQRSNASIFYRDDRIVEAVVTQSFMRLNPSV
jgi:hypothetical protein